MSAILNHFETSSGVTGIKRTPADLETMDQSVYWGVGKRPEREKIPKICKDGEIKEIYFNTLAGLNEIEEPVSRRIFSKNS